MAEHLGGYVPGGDPWTRCEDLWRWFRHNGVRSVLDIGCGDGVALDFFASLGCDVLGVDGVPQKHPQIVCHDYTSDFYVPPRSFDLGWCCEFVEHIEEQFVPNFIASLRSCDWVALTHAFPGQQGHHHVNCRPAEYWIELLSEWFTHDAALSRFTRQLAGDPATNHFARSGLIFRRTS